MIKNRLIFLALLLSVGPFSSALFAQGDSALLEYRQSLMKTMGSQMGSIGTILKNKLPLKDNVATHARIIAINSELMAAGFEKKITAGRTDSQPAVWQQWSKFKTAAMATQRESQKLAEVAKTGSTSEIFAQMKNLGGTCGACHQDFRKPKGERFKR